MRFFFLSGSESRWLRCCLFGMLAGLPHLSPAAERDPAIEAGYRAARDLKVAEAARLLTSVAEPETPEGRFARALGLLGDPTRTGQKMAEAASLLEQVMAEAAGTELAAASGYFLARLLQVHADPVQPERAAALYQKLMDAYPESIYAEYAFVFLAVGRHYAPIPVAAKRAEVLRLDAEARTRLKSDVARRLYHLASGFVWSRVLHEADEAFTHWKIVHELGLESRFEYSNLLLRLAELSRRRGALHEALGYFREFDSLYPTDRRSGLVRDWIAHLEEETS